MGAPWFGPRTGASNEVLRELCRYVVKGRVQGSMGAGRHDTKYVQYCPTCRLLKGAASKTARTSGSSTGFGLLPSAGGGTQPSNPSLADKAMRHPLHTWLTLVSFMRRGQAARRLTYNSHRHFSRPRPGTASIGLAKSWRDAIGRSTQSLHDRQE